MRFKAFNARYRMLAPFNMLFLTEAKAVDDCEVILDCYSRTLKTSEPLLTPMPRHTEWAHGRKHVFLSEGARQLLERMRANRREKAAASIQRWLRVVRQRRAKAKQAPVPPAKPQMPLPAIPQQQQQAVLSMPAMRAVRPRPQPIMCTPPPEGNNMHADRCDYKVILQTCALFGLDPVISFIVGLTWKQFVNALF
jgi:dachs protein